MGQAENGRAALETFARLSNDEEQITRLERAVRHDDTDVEAWYQWGGFKWRGASGKPLRARSGSVSHSDPWSARI